MSSLATESKSGHGSDRIVTLKVELNPSKYTLISNMVQSSVMNSSSFQVVFEGHGSQVDGQGDSTFSRHLTQESNVTGYGL
jgi:hypothetical protein